ncbi:benzoate/H(+) symporter BenE family transporter [Neobacillus sp. OS1-33]|uniref:benzoate/H(+) symporter BenE family transporter n=1 Tax=Neobacillus sp. OS1-33 TaxID=3070683 RepID=UPI0027E190A0|nr:benzoate/H(+) symporter BenE family transporter [Neobacillus sp. OS1-33]WML27246.1 benzoate/H(+) symporter BenE family transporter [Neobacillus sp. OS1-33]
MNRTQEKSKWRRNILLDINTKNIAAGTVAGIFVITGPSALILEASSNGNFSAAQTILWIFSVYVFGGLLGIFLPLYYRIPIVGGHSLTGVAFLATMTNQFSFNELIGAYIVSGLLLLFVGLLSFFSRLVNLVPREIISAMLSGMIMKYMVNFIISTTQLLLVGAISLITFFVFSRWRTKIPPVIAAIIIGTIVLSLTYPINIGDLVPGEFLPQIQLPNFNIASFFSVSIPLALLILSNDVAVGIGALEQNHYHTPINRIVSFSGVFSVISGFFGGQSANIAGMATVICSDEEAGPKEKRFMGAVVSGALLLIFGLFSWKLVPFIQALPKEFISIIVGFSLLGVFSKNIHQSFSSPSIKISTTFALIIALSNITILNISSPIWSLLIGTVIARYIEKDTMGKIENDGKRSA